MQNVILEKKFFDDFISYLVKEQKLIAPVPKGDKSFSFEEVTSAEEIRLKYIPTILPPKKYFMPQYETLVEYDTSEGQKMQAVVELENLTLFGVHTCDLAGIQCLNVAFNHRPKDLNYLIRKNRITIIGLECNDYCDEHASCGLMGNCCVPNGGYDLFFTDMDDYFHVHINTQRGENLVKGSNVFKEATDAHITSLDKHREKKMKIFKPEVDVDRHKIPELFRKGFESKIWDELGDRCLSCGNCTNVCPTCYCFDVNDIPNLDLKTGKRIRVWDSCQNDPFAKVSGGESFREQRKDRKRHRFNRKFMYPVNKFSRFFCTGCGRCTRTCMAEINLKDTIKHLAEEYA